LAVTAGSVSGQIALPPAQAEVIEAAEVQSVRSAPVRFVVPLGIRCATLPDGTEVDMPSEEVWKPVCSNRVPLTVLDLQTMVATHAADFADPALVRVVDRQNGYAPRVGLNVVFSLGASVPAAAVPAFVAAEAYLEGQFTADTMTVTIPISFAALSPGVIGGTGSSYGSLTWASTRSTLVAGMDGTDTIQSFLPTASLPVRYSTSSTTNENQTFWTFANFKANGGSVAGNDASMQYSTAFPFDYDPSNGVSAGTISLQDVIIHETGHALGCTSGVDFRNRDLEVFDVFRFRRTDGSSDFNPDTTAEFTARPRWCVRNNPNDDVNLDVIGAAEYAVSDGSPYQASHFREQVPAIGIMDPAFSYGETFYPNFMRTSDITLFDAIGYNR
jgi:hypothetical protein